MTLTYSDLELILVDDSSPGRCPAICDIYAEKDARRDFVMFPDSDDYPAQQLRYSAASRVKQLIKFFFSKLAY